MPVFGRIKDIVVFQKEPPIFILTPYICTSCNNHFHAFEVSPLNEVLIYKQNQFLDHHPLTISQSFETSSPLFVCLKYNFV